jgi:hypothetical protein
MSRITFKGWLKSELQRLSTTPSLHLRTLAEQAQDSNPRMAELLLAYAIEIEASNRLMSYISHQQLKEEYAEVLRIAKAESLESLTAQKRTQLPLRYQKLLTNWNSVRDRRAGQLDSIALRYGRTKKLQATKGIRNAQIYHDLGLNPGNVNAYLKHADFQKVSLTNATNIMRYVMDY